MHDSANIQQRSIDRSVQREFWAVVSQTGLLGKLHPTPERQNGMGFPVEASSGNCVPELALRLGCNFPIEPLGETESHSGAPERDTASPDESPAMLRNKGRKSAHRIEVDEDAPGIRAGAV